MAAPRKLPGDRSSLTRPDLRAAMERAQREQRRALRPRCGTAGCRSHQDYFRRTRNGTAIGIVVQYLCPQCLRTFRKSQLIRRDFAA